MYDQDGSSSEDNSLEDCAGRSCSSTEWTHTYHLFRISLQRAAMGPMGTGMHQHFDIMPDKICRFQTMKKPVRCLSMPLPISGSFACSFLSFNIFQQDLANKSALRRSTGTSSIANFSSLIDRWTKCCSKCVCVPKLHCLSPLWGSKSMGSDIPSLPTDDQEMEHSPLGMDFPCRVRSGVSPQSKPLRLNKAYGKAAASDYEAHEIHFFQLDGRHHVSRNAKYSKCLNLGHFLAGAGRHHSEDVGLDPGWVSG